MSGFDVRPAFQPDIQDNVRLESRTYNRERPSRILRQNGALESGDFPREKSPLKVFLEKHSNGPCYCEGGPLSFRLALEVTRKQTACQRLSFSLSS